MPCNKFDMQLFTKPALHSKCACTMAKHFNYCSQLTFVNPVISSKLVTVLDTKKLICCHTYKIVCNRAISKKLNHCTASNIAASETKSKRNELSIPKVMEIILFMRNTTEMLVNLKPHPSLKK